jgi:hypothetical protein
MARSARRSFSRQKEQATGCQQRYARNTSDHNFPPLHRLMHRNLISVTYPARRDSLQSTRLPGDLTYGIAPRPSQSIPVNFRTHFGRRDICMVIRQYPVYFSGNQPASTTDDARAVLNP